MKNIVIEGISKLYFRNFSGAAVKFNPVGRRNFCIFLEPQIAENLINDGWNVRTLNPKQEGDEPQPYLQVTVMFGKIPPKIVLVTSKKKTTLDEATVNILDYAEISNVDLIIRPYNWEAQGKSGIKAYVKSMYVTIVEDEFASKYDDIPDSAIDNID